MTPEQMRQRIAELEEGLRPFADLAVTVDGCADYAVVHVQAHVVRRAASLLSAAQPASEPDKEEVRRHGIYVASRASLPARGEMWRALRASGVNITSSWIDEDGEGQTADFGDLWSRIEREVKSSERLILYAESGDFPLKGAYIEVGIAIAAGIPVFVVLPGVDLQLRSCRPVGSWIKHPLVTVCTTVDWAVTVPLPSGPGPHETPASTPASEPDADVVERVAKAIYHAEGPRHRRPAWGDCDKFSKDIYRDLARVALKEPTHDQD